MQPLAWHGCAAADAWLVTRRGMTVNSDATQLFCLPQAGMSSCVYQSWADKLAPEIKVLPVELPGHGRRMLELRFTDLCTLSREIVDALHQNILSAPYALFGHSMGAWIVWEVLQELTRRGLPLPVHLFASGNRAPHLSAAAHDVDPTRLHKLPPADFWVAMKRRYGPNPRLEDPYMRKLAYPMLKDDFTLVETYQPSAPDVVTTVPITAVGAMLDTRYTPKQISAWMQHTTGRFQEVWLEDLGHHYISQAPDKLLTAIRRQLLSPETATDYEKVSQMTI